MTVRRPRAWLLLVLLFAVAWCWPVLGHAFRSDDYATVYYLDRESGAVRWGRVFEEWLRPWFGVRDLWRPLVSLSFGANWALSTSPAGFHAFNLLLLAGTAAAVAAAAARLAPARPRLAGLCAGACVVLHPAAVEPAAWIAARTTGLQVFWSAVAYWSFLRWRDGDGRPWLPLLAAALACASKEGAVLLPVSMVALDLLRGRGGPNWRTHAPFVLLIAAWLGWRWWRLGVFTTAEEGHTLGERLHGAGVLFAQLVAPPQVGLAATGLVTVSALALAAALVFARGGWRALWCGPWAFVLLTPGTTHARLGDELAGRFVFDAVPALALFVALAADCAGRRRWSAGLFAVVLGALALALGASNRAILQRYGDESRTIARVQRELLAAAKGAGPGRPFGVVGLPKLPLLQPGLWGFLAQKPFAERDLPVVGLDNLLTPEPSAPRVYGDSTAVHALVADGAGCATWNAAREQFVPFAKADPGAVEFVRDPADPRRFVPPRLLPPTAVAALEVVSPVKVRAWEVKVLGNLEGPLATAPLRGGVMAGADGDTRWWCTTTQVLPWFVAATLGGGPAGVELTCDGGTPAPGTVVRAHATQAARGAPREVPGVVDRRDLVGRLEAPEAKHWSALYLLLPTGLFAMEWPARRPLAFPAPIQAQIDYACDVLGTCRIHWFWTDAVAPPGEVERRGSFGTCVIR